MHGATDEVFSKFERDNMAHEDGLFLRFYCDDYYEEWKRDTASIESREQDT